MKRFFLAVVVIALGSFSPGGDGFSRAHASPSVQIFGRSLPAPHADTASGTVPIYRGSLETPSYDGILPRERVLAALYQFGWTEPAASWVASQVPFYIVNSLEPGYGAFYPGLTPSVGYVVLSPEPKNYVIEHEARHAANWAYGKADFWDGRDENLRDLAILAAGEGDVAQIAREIQSYYAEDWAHIWHRVADWTGRDYALVPEPIRSRRFATSLGGVAPKYRAFLPLVPTK
jgi:hypothetical protein